MLNTLLYECLLAKLGPAVPGLITCAVGRALDFATTWTGLTHGLAAEAKPGAAHVVAFLGPQLGLICYEALITTPIIFAGCWLTRWVKAGRASKQTSQAGLLYFVGTISLLVAALNARFLV